MAIKNELCSSCKGIGAKHGQPCYRCGGYGEVEVDTTDKYYYWLIGVVFAYMAFQVLRAFLR